MATDYLLDTNVLVALLRENELGRRILDTYNLGAFLTECMISIVTVGEMEKLGRSFGWDNERLGRMRELLDQLVQIDVSNQAILYAYADIDCLSAARGTPMGKNDVWIAATARATGPPC